MPCSQRPLGQTSLSVPALCFGAAPLGDMPDTYGIAVDEEQARATIHAVFDGPVNFLDTSRNYGAGRSEQRIGQVIAERGGLPEGFVLSTKLDRDAETGRMDAARVCESLEASLRLLNLDHIPLLHLHDPEHCRDLGEITAEGGAIDAMFRLKEEGLCSAVGLAMGRLDIMEPIVRAYPFDALISHNRYTLLNRSASPLFDYAHAQGIAVLNAAPYAAGVLAQGSEKLPMMTYQNASYDDLAPVRRIEAICAEHGIEMGAAALQFSLKDPRITSTIVGLTQVEQIEQNLAWAQAQISPEAQAALDTIEFSMEDPEANRAYQAE